MSRSPHPASRTGRVRESLRLSIKDGLWWSVMSGIAEANIVPFAVALRAGVIEIGFLRSAPQLLSSLCQLRTPDLVHRVGGRRIFIAVCALLQALGLCGAAVCVLLPRAWGLWLFIPCAMAYSFFGTMAGPPWASMMGEYLPMRKRGLFLGWRNRLLGICLTSVGLAAGWVLSLFGKTTLRGFVLLFLAASAARLVSAFYLSQMFEPRSRMQSSERFTFWKFIAQYPRSNFASFTVTTSLLMFGTHLASPFFAVFLLQDLRFGYLLYTVVMMSGTLSLYLSMRYWGRWADELGGVRAARIALIMVPVIPLLWCLSQNVWYLALTEAFSGFIWAAYSMGTNNFIYDTVSPAKRTRCAAYHAASTGFTQCSAALLGGFLYTRLPPLWGQRFYSLILLSAALRAAAVWLFLRQVREVRAPHEARPKALMLAMLGVRPLFYR